MFERVRFRCGFARARSARAAARGMLLGIALLAGGVWAACAARPTDERPTAHSGAQKYWIFLEQRPSPSRSVRRTRPVADVHLRRLRALGVRPLVHSRWFHAVSARLSPEMRRTVAQRPYVRRTQPVGTLSPLRRPRRAPGRPGTTRSVLHAAPPIPAAPPRSPAVGALEGPLRRIHALPPLARGWNGRGVRIGFLDASFAGLRHPAFVSLRADGRLAALRSFPRRRQGGTHGLSVVSVAAGYDADRLVGPAFGATVLGATTEYTQFERTVEEDHFVAGLEWLYRRGADVVNVSIGYTTFDEGQRSYAPEDLDGNTALTTRAVDRAARLGMTVVVSAGNSGCGTPDSCWYYVNTPADADSAITVGAVAPDSSLAPFSARGPTADGRRKPDVLVQGQAIPAASARGRYARVSGTSFASPQVTAVVAQMLQVNPSLGPMAVRQLLRQTASQAQTPDTSRGWGIVNADAAFRTAEWLARRTPPSQLQVAQPYRSVRDSALIVPVSAPSHTAALRVRMYSPQGRRLYRATQPAHAGPNRLRIDASAVPPGRYRCVVVTDRGRRATRLVTFSP